MASRAERQIWAGQTGDNDLGVQVPQDEPTHCPKAIEVPFPWLNVPLAEYAVAFERLVTCAWEYQPFALFQVPL